MNVLIPVNDVLYRPLSHTALRRQRYGKMPSICGRTGILTLTYSNACKAKLFDLDFSAAVRTPGAGNSRLRFQSTYRAISMASFYPVGIQ